MKNYIKLILWSGIALAMLNLVWNVISIYVYAHFPLITNSNSLLMLKIFSFGLLFSALSHFVIISGVIIHIRRSRKYFTGGLILGSAGLISFILLFFHWAGVHDYLMDTIQKETGELNKIYFNQSIHLFFYVFTIVYFFLLNKSGNSVRTMPGVSSEQLFMLVHISGIICGIAGLIMIKILYHFYGGRLHGSDLTPFVFIILPWLLIFTIWLISFLRDKHSGRYDEKLAIDINKTGMVVLVLSVLLVSAMAVRSFLGTSTFNNLYIDGRMDILWLPIYVFMALLSYSAIAIYNFKQN